MQQAYILLQNVQNKNEWINFINLIEFNFNLEPIVAISLLPNST